MQQILSCFGPMSLLAAAESSGDTVHGLLWICLNGFSKQMFGLGPVTALASSTPALCSDAGLRRPWLMPQPVGAVEATRIDQVTTEIRLSQICAIQPSAPEVAAPK